MTANRSLWDRVPRDVRFELVPIASTALLLQAGAATADALVRLSKGIPYGAKVNQVAVDGVQGILILVNFAVVFWFGYRTLRSVVAKGGELSLNARLIGLASAFITSFELYSYALKTHQPELLVYAIVVVFYVFVVPFVLMRETAPAAAVPADAAAERRQTAVQALLGVEVVAYALVPCVAAVVVGSLYFAFMNEGIPFDGKALVRSFVRDGLGIQARTEFWGFSPGILGIAWLQALILTAQPKSSPPDKVGFGLDRRGRWIVGIASFAINIILALLLIGEGSIAGASGAAAAGPRTEIAKAILAVGVTVAFLGAYVAAAALGRGTTGSLVGPRSLLRTALFAAAGASVGLILMLLRTWLGDSSPLLWHRVWMHALGFALTYAAGSCALRLLQGKRCQLWS